MASEAVVGEARASLFEFEWLFRTLWRRRVLVAGIFGAVLLLAGIYTAFATPMYEATSLLLVKFGREYMYRDDVGGGGQVMPRSRETLINSEIQILRSAAVVQGVVEEMGVATLYPALAENPPEDRPVESVAAGRFLTNLQVAAVENADVIQVSLRTPVYTAATNNYESTSQIDVAQLWEGDGTLWDQNASTDISDAGIRTFIKLLDDVDAPMANRYIVVPTIVKFDLLGNARFTEQAFVGDGSSIRNGLVGDIYGMEVFVTNQLPTVEDVRGTADNIAGVVFQRDAALLVEQLGVRSQTQYKQEYLADLFTVDIIYGVKTLRSTSVVPFVVPTT